MREFTNNSEEMKEFFSPNFPGSFHVQPGTAVPVCDADMEKFKAENPDWPEVEKEEEESPEAPEVFEKTSGPLFLSPGEPAFTELEFDRAKEARLTNAETLG